MSLRCAVTLQYGNLSLGPVYLLKRFIMVKKRFIIRIDRMERQNKTFTCDIVYHRCFTFDFYELVNVFSCV